MDDKKLKIEVLEKAKKTLKEEFVGLDSIIDEIIAAVTPWYITPEIIKRPVVVSLWGMTGTGKSSVVKRLIELLDINTSISFDCGTMGSDRVNITSSIMDTLGFDSDDTKKTASETLVPRDPIVMVFDEFQYARSINSSGEEEVQGGVRPIWTILDSGILEVGESFSWSFNSLCSFAEDLKVFSDEYPDIKVKNNMIYDPAEIKIYNDSLGFLYKTVPGLPGYDEDDTPTTSDDSNKDPNKPVSVLGLESIRTLARRLSRVNTEKLNINIIQDLLKSELTIKELSDCINKIISLTTKSVKLDCSKSLVFIIGNLDEAFEVQDDISPDMDADIFYNITKNVTIHDIKESLSKRFRAEEIARLGNNLIKYPTLKRSHFEEIIKREVSRIKKDFKERIKNIDLEIDKPVLDLLYYEGVYPTQGVRPIFTSINTLLTPILSQVILNCSTKAIITLDNAEEVVKKKFRLPEVTILIESPDLSEPLRIKQNLTLGSLRYPKIRKKVYAISIHETGHALVQTYLTGKTPDTIISVSTNRGGFCSTYDEGLDQEIESIRDINNEVMIDMAGWAAERLFFSPERCLLGSNSDISKAWKLLSNAAYRSGYYFNRSYSDLLCDEKGDGIGQGMNPDEINWRVRSTFNNLEKETTKILKENIGLLKKTALILSETGIMTGNEFMALIEKNEGSLTLSRIKHASEINDPEYYKNKIEGRA
jgi:cell division protease FtsH